MDDSESHRLRTHKDLWVGNKNLRQSLPQHFEIKTFGPSQHLYTTIYFVIKFNAALHVPTIKALYLGALCQNCNNRVAQITSQLQHQLSIIFISWGWGYHIFFFQIRYVLDRKQFSQNWNWWRNSGVNNKNMCMKCDKFNAVVK